MSSVKHCRKKELDNFCHISVKTTINQPELLGRMKRTPNYGRLADRHQLPAALGARIIAAHAFLLAQAPLNFQAAHL
jgi:hypothetical protein